MTIERAISAMIMEKIDSSAALYSALVTVNPMIPSGYKELFAVVAISSKFKVVFHLGFKEVVMTKLYSVSGSKLVMLNGGLNSENSSSLGWSTSTVPFCPFWLTNSRELVKLSALSLLVRFAALVGITCTL